MFVARLNAWRLVLVQGMVLPFILHLLCSSLYNSGFIWGTFYKMCQALSLDLTIPIEVTMDIAVSIKAHGSPAKVTPVLVLVPQGKCAGGDCTHFC